MRKLDLLAVAVPVGVFAVYLATLYPTVGWVDCGEIAAGCHMLNVLHPTGYPLFTLLGNLFARLPLGTVATRVNALSALLSAVAAAFCYLTVVRLSRSRVAGLVSAALLAFSYTVWSNSVDADVFGLTACYVSLTIYLLVTMRDEPRLQLTAFLLGLALTNHMSFASTFVGALLGLFIIYRAELLKPRTAVPLLLLFLLGLTPYLYLLLRSPQQPLLNWGNAYNLERLVWHITGKQYQVWMFSQSLSEVLRNLGRALSLLGRELYFVLIPLFGWGVWILLRKRVEVFWLLTVVFVLNLLYAINYSIPDIQSYYIPFMTAAFIFTGVGLAELMRRRPKLPRPVFALLVILPLAVNFRRAGAQGDHVAEDFGRNYLASTPDRAIVMTTNWDMYSPIFYLRQVRHERLDVCIIDKELLRRTWYFQSLRQEYPWLIERSQAEVDTFLRYLDQFEHGTLQGNQRIQAAFIAMVNSFITRNPERRAFLTFDQRNDYDAKDMLPRRLRIPHGLLYELADTATRDTFDYNTIRVRRPNLVLDERTQLNLSTYERMATERAAYLVQTGRLEEARVTLDWVLREFPKSPAAVRLKAQLPR